MSRTVESVREIDVNWCNREGLLEPGASGTITWSNERTGEETGSVAYTAVGNSERASALRLDYTMTSSSSKGHATNGSRPPAEWTPPRAP